MSDAIAVEGLTKSYGRTRGVIELTFTVAPGEVFGYLGPNGAGKTTTIRTLLDFIRPTAGSATVLGLDSRRDSIEIHRRTGYLPGEFTLYENLLAGEYLEHLAALRDGVDQAYLRTLAERFDLDLGMRIRSLSHGNRQKVGLLQAFMHRPELLVLDEPTQGLDPLMQQEFYELIGEASREGRTVFLSSHVMPEVERVCDRVAIIRRGRLVAVEDIGDLRAKELRRLEIHFAGPVPAIAFDSLDGVHRAEAEGDRVRVTVAGPLDAVIKAAAGYEVIDLVSHEQSLEDIFLAFYGREGEPDGR
ncbi:MAG: ABC transporter ATP-binding protein [Actinomycetota bacterium]